MGRFYKMLKKFPSNLRKTYENRIIISADLDNSHLLSRMIITCLASTTKLTYHRKSQPGALWARDSIQFLHSLRMGPIS